MGRINRIVDYLSGCSYFNLRTSVVQKLIALTLGFCHIILLFAFLVFEIYLMAFVNVLSITTYIIAIYLSGKGHNLTFFRIIYWEIMIHLVITTISVGFSSGFELYCMAMVPISYYCKFSLSQHDNNSYDNHFNPFLHSVIAITIYVSLKVYSHYHSALYIFGSDMFQKNIYTINFIIVIAALIAFMSTFVAQVFMLEYKLKSQNNFLEKLSHTDSLTGLYNRRSIDEYIENDINESKNYAVIMSDIDDFKKINDQYGHEFGDTVLELVASIYTNNTRANDIVCRWGGEEILVLLPNCTHECACRIAEDIRKKISETSITNRGKTIHFTMTFGIAHSSQADSTHNIIHLADKRLYYGKSSGKNCIISDNIYKKASS